MQYIMTNFEILMRMRKTFHVVVIISCLIGRYLTSLVFYKRKCFMLYTRISSNSNLKSNSIYNTLIKTFSFFFTLCRSNILVVHASERQERS